ncbi:MAG TPA: RNA 2',3'-cyclic phosphodiesterase [Candidatus Binataceae bacterium]|nr:RNA 2',3'-cyclic phosphodiesterase [Candidatus Binataceae bacterium]
MIQSHPLIRAFVALRLEPAAASAVAAFQTELRLLSAEVAWTRATNFHVTVRFLGNQVAPALLAALTPGLAAIAARTPPFTIEIRGTGSFPSTRPRVLWVGIRSDPLKALAAEVEASVRAAGFPPAAPLVPHLTLGRMRGGSRLGGELGPALRRAADRCLSTSAIDRLVLYQSRLGAGGATYLPLHEFALEGGPGDKP